MEFWTSASDGSGLLQIGEQAGGDIQWLDAHRLLITSPIAKDQPDLILSVYDTRDNSQYVLGQFQWVRGLSVAPGGERLLFYLVMQALEAQNGLYVLETQAGATPQKLPFFGGWRWRDADSLYYLPLEAGERGPDTAHRLAYYHIPTGTNFALTDPTRLPFVVADNDWAVSPDGDKILFMNAKDLNLWLLERQP
jgi:Tol biopolymer transport system component